MSDVNSNIDCEAQSLLAVSTGTSPRRIWNQLIFLQLSISIFISGKKSSEGSDILSGVSLSTSSYNNIGNSNATDTDHADHSEVIYVDDGSPATPEDSSNIGSVQEINLRDIENQHSEIIEVGEISQALCEDTSSVHSAHDSSHHGIELQFQSKISEAADSLTATSEDASIIQMFPENSHHGKLQRSQTAKIIQIVKEKNFGSFHDFGGVQGVADALNTDVDMGLCDEEDIYRRKMKTVFQCQLPEVSFIHFLIDACRNCTIRLLLLAAALSLGFGLKEEGRQNGWIDGAIIFLTIIVLVTFTSLRRYFHEKKSLKKSRKQDSSNEMEMEVLVTRRGCNQRINSSDLVYGDIVSLKRGHQVPGDGLFIVGKSLEVDSVLRSTIDDQNPFLFYGSRIINGSGRMIVTSVGTNTVWSEMMSKANSTDKKCKLEPQFDKLTNLVDIIGLAITILMFIVLFLRFVVWKQHDGNGYRPEFKGERTAFRMIINTIENIITEPKGMARALTTLLSVSLVGLMEGLPLVVSIAVTLWNANILSDKATCHDLLACVKMASVTCICTDKIGGLTEHQMEVDTFSIGYEVITETSMICPKVLEVLCEGIGPSVLIPQDARSSMEASLCSWAKDVVGFRSNIFERSCKVLQWTKLGPDPSENPCGVLMERIGDSGKEMCLHWKGPVKQILAMCSHYYDRKGKSQDMDSQKRLDFEHASTDMMNKQLKVIAFACRPTVACELEKKDLILIGLLGLKDSSKENTKQAIARAFKEGGVKTIIVSADDVSVLEPIAVEYGVLNLDSDDLVLKGVDFQNFTETERMEKVDRICVMGNCLPSDKQVLVKYLRERGKVVAMVGWQTNDAPALKESDIGVAMGTWNLGKARESSDIIIWDRSLSFLVNMIECGRCAYGKLRKFIQVQLIMTISSSLINFIGIIFTGDAPMTPIQLFGLNLAMTFIDGMALLSGPLSGKQASELTVGPTEPLITKAMTRNLVLQTSYQIIILTTLQQKGHVIMGITQKSIQYMIFNSFILCLVFNLFHSRELDKNNFFGGIHHDYLFWVALAVYSLLHLVFILVEQRLDRSTSLNCKKWAGCFLIGIISWLVDFVGKFTLHTNRIDCFTGWIIGWAGKCKLVFIEKDWFTRGSCSYPESSPSELISNLHYPLITSSESSTIPQWIVRDLHLEQPLMEREDEVKFKTSSSSKVKPNIVIPIGY